MIELIHAHEDERGFVKVIKNLLSDNREFVILEIKKGYARGGCQHKRDEWFVVIEGRLKVVIGEEAKIYKRGEAGKFEKFMPHAFIALEDSIIAEWNIPTEEKMNDIKDKKLRARVDSINKRKRL